MGFHAGPHPMTIDRRGLGGMAAPPRTWSLLQPDRAPARGPLRQLHDGQSGISPTSTRLSTSLRTSQAVVAGRCTLRRRPRSERGRRRGWSTRSAEPRSPPTRRPQSRHPRAYAALPSRPNGKAERCIRILQDDWPTHALAAPHRPPASPAATALPLQSAPTTWRH